MRTTRSRPALQSGRLLTARRGRREMLWWVIGATFPVLWLWAFYREDRFEREPPWRLVVAFGLGCLAILPARLLEDLLLPQGLGAQDSLLARAAGLLLVAGPVEELCKFAPVRLHIYR